MNTNNLKIFRLIFLGTLIFVLTNLQIAGAQKPKRIALLPFKINSEKDLSFLKDGIFDMLTTRLSKEGQVEVIGRPQVEAAMQAQAESAVVNEVAARRIGTSLGADFVLFGSLTVLGNNVSIDARMVDIAGSKPTMTFFDQSQDLGAVISKINLIAADINAKMLGRTAVATKEPEVRPQPTKKTGIHAHPEKVLQEDGFISGDKRDAADSLDVLPGEARESQRKFWKSANFKYLINGVALGDVDGDGKIEIVTITPHSVVIYRSEGGQFRKIDEMEESFNQNLTGVDIADINGNGYAEIFITSLNAENKILNSFVLEYDGKNFTKIVEDSFWYYRVVDTPARGKKLLGQKSRVDRPFSGIIHEMAWQNREYIPVEEIKSPPRTNLLGFTIGDIMNTGQETAIAYKDDDRLRIIDASGKSIWDGSEHSGGSMLWYSLPREDRQQIDNRQYYPMRLVVWRNKSAKESEVITVKNHDITGRKLEYRSFSKTEIEAFKWDGVGLSPSWKTRTISGYIQDFTVGDFDNDGQDELIAALIIKEGRVAFLSEPKSTLIGYELSSPQQPESEN